MLINLSSLAVTSKFQKNICFKMRAVGLINIKTKEWKSGRHLWKWSIQRFFSLAVTSKFQKNICFKMRAVGLINIKTKEWKSGRHLWKWSIQRFFLHHRLRDPTDGRGFYVTSSTHVGGRKH